ncbi:uncharacterized protein LOC132717933 [Ruditapes philippinarum]|uniref:uncharacterized protein LOC132717933 n=1 Tax=Ruditapes philippinarum TaxID=129788 RepID=UPI00295B79E2|nr:uncharacterized protein LOC132717933 [Ruditapes philippinarum]
MAFVVTYHNLSKHNIRNLYGGLPAEIKWRTTSNSKSIVPAQRVHEQMRKSAPHEKFLNERYYEYDPENEIRIPRAPAFQQLSRSRVDEIVDRLSRPTVSKRRRASEVCEREARRAFIETCRKCRALSAQPKASRQRADEITERLILPTVTSNVRKSMRSLGEFDVPEVRDACDKCSLTPSNRFAKEFSIYNI